MKSNKVIRVRLGDLNVIEEFVRMRQVDDQTVNEYAQAYRAGAKFPPLIIDQDNNVVSGNHRYMAMLKEFGPDALVEVIRRKYRTERARLEDFAIENTQHGKRLSGFSKHAIANRLQELGATKTRVAEIFGVGETRIEKWGDMTVVVVKADGSKSRQAKKKGFDPEGGKVTEKQYEDHRIMDLGMTVTQQCSQLSRWLRDDLVRYSDQNIDALETLGGLIDSFLARASKKKKKESA